ncbi:glycosyltransferase [Spirosoma sp. KCTC 42546]|uniref:glycosyltransferase n=1 Tax=Spirosoma sp. KCTC 42546 TaxID=2520506 RepID=UPI00115B1CD9|nr:glycosyltransferase [Spirosoma sp. KCTC 42546]QDK79610.1 glycosyltransferase [Spirosoma sp. KCTC 42546]
MTTSVQPTVSIALCTYNGMAYLTTQWNSLLGQERLPDEVVISDDRSTDGTGSLLETLAATAPFLVRILENQTRLGYNKNFERALAACTGDLIFICDQDDFWLPEKISTMVQYMVQHPEIQIAFCDAWVTDENLEGRQNRFWEAVRFDKETQKRWKAGETMDVLLDGNRMMGCATVIRRAFLPTLLPIPDKIPGYIYDGWIAMVAATQNAIHFIDKPLQLYRTHVQQQVGVRQQEVGDRIRLRDRLTRHRARKLAPLLKKRVQLSTISELLSKRVPANSPGLPQLYRRLDHFSMRSNLPHNRLKRISPVLSNLLRGNYRRYADAAANWYAPLLAVLGDIFE